MSDDNNTTRVTDEMDLVLNRAIRNLPREVDPDRDLWRGIEAQLEDRPQSGRSRWNWQSAGIAASLVLASAALLLVLQDSRVIIPAGGPGDVTLATDDSLARLEAGYLQVRTPLVEQFNQTNRDLDDSTRAELQRNLDILTTARKEIEAAVREDPDNPRLVELLIKIHEQELALLRQDFSPSRYL